jgi:hypothetical protein
MKIFVLVDSNCSGTVYFKGYNPYTKELQWTGVQDRACFWKARDCAEEQALDLNMKMYSSDWTVLEVSD